MIKYKLYGKKKVGDRMVDTYEIDTLKRKPKKIGNGYHVLIPKGYHNKIIEIKIIILKPFVCRGCVETFSDEKHFSPDPKLCSRCYAVEEFLKKNKDNLKCRKCDKKITEEEYRNVWGDNICPDCWEEEAEEESGINKTINQEDSLD